MFIELKSYGDKPYKVCSGTWYHAGTPDAVIEHLEVARVMDTRIRLYYGDTETGRSWLDEWGMIGTINRSCGAVKIPLLIANSRSTGGPGLLEHCIVAIQHVADKRYVYQHPKFHIPAMTSVIRIGNEYPFCWKLEDGSVQAAFKEPAKSTRWYNFIHGNRMAK